MLDSVIEDYEERQNGYEIAYVVDFSEIYAFTFPGRDQRAVALVDEPSAEVARIVEVNALSNLFGGEATCFLPAPYKVELDRFLARLRAETLDEVLEAVPAAVEEARELLDRREAQELLALAEKVGDRPERLSGDVLTRAVGFFEQHAEELTRLVWPETYGSLRRLVAFLDAKVLQPLEAVAEIDLRDLEEEIEDTFMFFEENREYAGSGSNYIDAVATETIAAVNSMLRGEKKRLTLVTRSPAFAALLEEAGDGNGVEGSVLPIRHPVTFGDFFEPSTAEASEILDQLRDRRDSLELLLNSASLTLQFLPHTRAQIPALIKYVRRLAAEWGEAQELASKVGFDLGWVNKKGLSTDAERALLLLEMLRGSQEIVLAIGRRVNQIAKDLGREHEFLGWYLQSGSAEAQSAIEERLHLEGFPRRTLLVPTVDAWLYTLEFYSEDLHEALSRIGGQRELTFDEIFDLFQVGFGGRDDYERLLAMAFTIALLGRWSLAEQYCEVALREGKRDGVLDLHEGLFFLAVCKRRSERNEGRVREGLGLLEEAEASRRRSVGAEADADPRFMKEEATQLQVLRSLKRAEGEEEEEEEWQAAVEGIEKKLRSALTLVEDEGTLRVQIQNGLTYLYLTERWPAFQEEAGAAMTELVGEVKAVHGGDPSAWPANVLDTVFFGRARVLGREASEEVLEECASWVEVAAERSLLPSEDRSRIRAHAEEIRRRIGDR